jgi:hypothetical protein
MKFLNSGRDCKSRTDVLDPGAVLSCEATKVVAHERVALLIATSRSDNKSSQCMLSPLASRGELSH